MVDSLADNAARSAIETDLDTTLIVEAGAGTGKTQALVSRIVALVASGITSIDRIAAITFTVAAAAELRSRVRSAIESALGLDGSTGDAQGLSQRLNVPIADVDRRLSDALVSVDKAAITTIHAYAQGILTAFPLQAGLPPGFRIADELEASIAFRERWIAFIDELFESEESRPEIRTALLLGLQISHLEALARTFHENWDRIRDVEFADPAELPEPNSTPVVAALDNAIARISVCQDETDTLLAHLRSLIPFRDDLAAASGDELIDLAVTTQMRKENYISVRRIGRKDNWGGEDGKQELLDDLDAAQVLFDEMLEPLRHAVLMKLAGKISGFTLDGVQDRLDNGTLEFHDLLVHTRDLLRGNTQVRSQLRQQYSHVLVDEFQDTDPLQLEICALIAAPDGDIPAKAAWSDLAADSGRVFFVGDPKQSIYRFRRADIDIYLAAKSGFGGGGGPKPIDLTVNFRSHHSIVDWVNSVFADVIGGESRVGQAGYVALTVSRTGEHPDLGSRVWVIGGAHEGRANEVRATESTALSAAINQIRNERWTVDTRDHEIPGGVGAGRQVEYKDIAVLIRGRNSLAALEEAFETAQIPYRVEARSLVLNSQEVRDILAVLTAVADPSDEVAAVAALRSSAFGCSDRDLIEYSQAVGNRRDAWHPAEGRLDSAPPDNPVTGSLERLHDYRSTLWWRGPTGLIEHIVTDTKLMQKAMWSKNFRESWRRIRYLTDQCRSFVATAGGGGINEFLEWVQRQADDPANTGEALLADPDEDAVRVTTIHASKGLQYPIAIVAGIGSAGKATHHVPAIWTRDGEIELSLGRQHIALETPGFHDAIEAEAAMEQSELARLLYVAATRAEDHLIVSLYHKPVSANTRRSGAEVIIEALEPEAGHRCGDELVENGIAFIEAASSENPAPRTDWAAPSSDDPDAAACLTAIETWKRRRRASIDAARHTPIMAATAAAPAEEDAAELVRSGRRGRAGTAIGRAVHGVLQVIDLETGEHIDELCREQAAAESVDSAGSEIKKLVTSVLRSSTVKAAAASVDYWREVFAGSMLGESQGIEGYIDLLYRDATGLVVVDYKTDSADSDDEIDALMEKYKHQGSAYADVLKKATGEPISDVVFVFARVDGATERRLPEFSQLGHDA